MPLTQLAEAPTHTPRGVLPPVSVSRDTFERGGGGRGRQSHVATVRRFIRPLSHLPRRHGSQKLLQEIGYIVLLIVALIVVLYFVISS